MLQLLLIPANPLSSRVDIARETFVNIGLVHLHPKFDGVH